MKKKENYKSQLINSFDLNDYLESGRFSCDSDRIAKIIVNSPVDTSFWLHVEQLKAGNESIQLLMQGCSGDIYYRVVSSEVTEWKKVITENLLDEIRVELSEKVTEEALRNLKDSLIELLNNKADISFVKEVENKLYDLILDKVSADSLTDLESKLTNLFENKTDKEELDKKLELIKNEINELINLKISEVESKFVILDDKIKNTYQLSGGTEIINHTDLNDYLKVGNYYCSLNSNAITLINRPNDLNSAFVMKVIAGNGVDYPSQNICALATGNMYYRTYDTMFKRWLDWIKVSSK